MLPVMMCVQLGKDLDVSFVDKVTQNLLVRTKFPLSLVSTISPVAIHVTNSYATADPPSLCEFQSLQNGDGS